MTDPSARYDRLRTALQHGDPLSEGEPAAADVQRLRARVLRAAVDRAASRAQAPWWLANHRRAALAAACVAPGVAVVALVTFYVWLGRPTPRPTAVARHEAAAPLAAVATPPAVAPDVHPSTANAQLTHTPIARPGRDAQPAASPVPPSVDEEDRPRQLQFTTPGGTRIVWVLNPQFRLAPGAPQQEEPRWSED
jgi:hypothetical protein